jgi:hypothetical protein
MSRPRDQDRREVQGIGWYPIVDCVDDAVEVSYYDPPSPAKPPAAEDQATPG